MLGGSSHVPERELSELERILITSVATIMGGVTVFSIGQVISKFFIEPIYEQRQLMGRIAHSLLYFGHHFADSADRTFEEVAPASDTFRRHASDLMARTVGIPGYRVFGFFRVIRPFGDIVRARKALIGLSNVLQRADWERKMSLAQEAADALGVVAIDKGLLKPGEM